jgi:hypothetical protein
MWAAVSKRQTVIIPGRRPRKKTSPSEDHPVSLTMSRNAVFADAFGCTTASKVMQINSAATFEKPTINTVRPGRHLMSSVLNSSATIMLATARRNTCHVVGLYASETNCPKLAKKSATNTAFPEAAKIHANVVIEPLK